VLFLCHLMGLMFFLMLIGSAELRAVRDLRTYFFRFAGLIATMAGPIVLWAFTALSDVPAAAEWPRPDVKLVNAASPFINYVFSLDVITALLVYGGIASATAAGWLIIAPRAVAAVVALPVAYVALPFNLVSASFLDMRVAVMFGFLLFAAINPAGEYRFRCRIAVAFAVLLFTVRMAVVAKSWIEHRRDLAELRAAIDIVPPGSRVYFTNVPREEAPAYWDAGPLARRLSNTLRTDYHLPALLLIERGAFWPVLFANPAQQPIRLRPAYARLAREAHDIPSHADLVAEPERALPALRDFDFVLLLEAGADPDLANFIPCCLKLVSRSDFAALFKVVRDAPAAD